MTPKLKVRICSASSVRILGGSFRGRRVSFNQKDEIRPTLGRIRETVFNWLSPYIQDSSCLDLFAGSGVLSFEAISRGASFCRSLDIKRSICQEILKNCKKLGIEKKRLAITLQSAEEFLSENLSVIGEFSIFFLDPPFKEKIILNKIINLLVQSNYLRSSALIYIESSIKNAVDFLPLSTYRQKKTSSMIYGLYKLNQ